MYDEQRLVCKSVKKKSNVFKIITNIKWQKWSSIHSLPETIKMRRFGVIIVNQNIKGCRTDGTKDME